MKKTFILLISVIMLSACKSEKTTYVKSDLVAANLKGNVWKIEKTYFNANPRCGCAAATRTESNKTLYIYDRQGKLISSRAIDDNGDTSLRTAYIYKRSGECREINRYEGENLVGKDVPVFQGAKLTGYKVYDKNGVNETTMNYTYEGDQLVEEKTLNREGKVVSSMQNEYLSGQLVSQTEKDSTGQVITIRHYKRNSAGDLTEYLIVVPKDSVEYRLTYEYEYDAAGNWIKQTRLYENAIEYIVVRNIEYYENPDKKDL